MVSSVLILIPYDMNIVCGCGGGVWCVCQYLLTLMWFMNKNMLNKDLNSTGYEYSVSFMKETSCIILFIGAH